MNFRVFASPETRWCPAIWRLGISRASSGDGVALGGFGGFANLQRMKLPRTVDDYPTGDTFNLQMDWFEGVMYIITRKHYFFWLTEIYMAGLDYPHCQ